MNEELKIIIRAELEQFKKAMNDAIAGIKGVASESRKASKSVDGFTAEVNQQGKALEDLKRKYVDLAKAHGQESKEAKEAAEAIKKLSAEYKTNKALAANLSNDANKFDVSLADDKTVETVEATTEGMGELRDALSNILALNVFELVGKGFDDWKKKVKDLTKTAKEEFNLAKIYFEQAWKELMMDPETLKDLNATGESMSDAFKGALISVKEGIKTLGSAASQAIAAIGAAIAVMSAVIVVDLLAVIALTKNALTMAKEIKKTATDASKAGLNLDAYQEWGYVFKQVGVEEGKLVDFTKKLAEKQNELRDGAEGVAEAFEAIGLSQEEVLNSNQEELFSKTVAGLQNIENEAERTSASFRIFTDDATDLTNLLYLTNQETKSLADNYYNLGGAPSDNLINKSKILEGSTTNLNYAWQGLKNTLAEWVIPAVITVVQWLTTAVAYLNIFLQGIFGVKSQSKGAAEGMESIGAGVGQVGTNANNATKAVKELLRYTMGFDELNVIPSQNTGSDSGSSNSGSSGGYSGTNINPEIPVIELPDTSKFKAFMEEYGSLIQGILTWAPILIGFGLVLYGIFAPGAYMALAAGVSLMGLGIAIGAAGGEESHWAKLGDAIVNVAKTVASFVISIWNGIKSVLSTVGSWINSNVIVPVSGFFKTLWSNITRIFSPAVRWFSELWSSVSATIGSIIEVIVGLFQGGWIAITHVWGIASTWFNETIIQPVAGFFSEMWEGFKRGASLAWEGVKSVFSPVASWFKDKFKTAWEGVKNVFSVGGKIFDGIKEGISKVFTTVVNGLIKGINKVIAAPFNTINGILNTIRNISIAGIKPFENTIKKDALSIPQIPQLAKGGIATSSILANIGERGKEAVLPLENNTGWMDILADRINSRNSPSKIVLMVDGRELGYAAINSINGITKQTGTLQLQLV